MNRLCKLLIFVVCVCVCVGGGGGGGGGGFIIIYAPVISACLPCLQKPKAKTRRTCTPVLPPKKTIY